MLITRAIPPQLPFKNRVGEVPDTRVLEIMQEIDETLGGRIDWPNVYVSELPREGVLGKYRSLAIRDGRTYPADLNADEEPSKRYGIHLDQKLVSGELTGCAYDKTMRHVLVHELQHAISHDNGNELADAARNAYDEYEWPDMPTAESRADMAMLLYAEMDQRQAAGGPALNELPADQRFEVVREVLTQYITPLESPPRNLSDIRLREMLRTDAYNHDPENQTWQEIAEPRTSAYLEGVAAYSPEEPFVPTGMDPRARQQEIATPLPELAARWAEERNERVATLEEWEARYDTARGTPGHGQPEPAVRGLTETATAPGRYETLGSAMSGWKPGCSAFAERIERRNAAEESGAVAGERPKQAQEPTNERQTEEKSPRGARGAENDQSSGTAQRTSGRFQMTHGADENLKPGWYVEKHGPTPDRNRVDQGTGNRNERARRTARAARPRPGRESTSSPQARAGRPRVQSMPQVPRGEVPRAPRRADGSHEAGQREPQRITAGPTGESAEKRQPAERETPRPGRATRSPAGDGPTTGNEPPARSQPRIARNARRVDQRKPQHATTNREPRSNGASIVQLLQIKNALFVERRDRVAAAVANNGAVRKPQTTTNDRLKLFEHEAAKDVIRWLFTFTGTEDQRAVGRDGDKKRERNSAVVVDNPVDLDRPERVKDEPAISVPIETTAPVCRVHADRPPPMGPRGIPLSGHCTVGRKHLPTATPTKHPTDTSQATTETTEDQAGSQDSRQRRRHPAHEGQKQSGR